MVEVDNYKNICTINLKQKDGEQTRPYLLSSTKYIKYRVLLYSTHIKWITNKNKSKSIYKKVSSVHNYGRKVGVVEG
jgi:hypothetical protein